MAVASFTDVYVGSTGKKLVIVITDENNLPRPLTTGGSTQVKLQGKSADLPGKTIDVAGTITDAPNGVVTWAGIGNGSVYVSLSDLGSLPEATFDLQAKYTDSGGLVDYGPVFQLTWKKPLL
jgi:hypothetical protein